MTVLRLLRLVVHLFAGLLTCALVFPLLQPAGREHRIRRWSAKLVSLCGVSVTVSADAVPQAHAMIVSNHVSWLDIFVINSLHPCRFVAKSEIRSWPLIGWLCEQAGTVFIARGKVRDVRRIYEGLVASLSAGRRVAFFPEGMVASQGVVLPFHANLFEAAIEAGVPVQPYALRYVDARGNYHPAVDFTGDVTFVQSVLNILRASGIRVELITLPLVPIVGTPHRRELAVAAREFIAEALGYEEREAPS